MKIAYINCAGGVAGDMILAALFGLGFSPEKVEKKIKAALPPGCPDWKLLVKDSEVNHLPGKKVRIVGEGHWQSPSEMKKIISGIGLASKVKKLAGKILQTLITAEARVHRIKTKDVHFHEINSIDTLIDILGAAYLLNELSPEKIICSAINLGRPAPATLEIVRMRHITVFSSNPRQEMATPTGLAIVANVVDDFGDMPKVKILGAGYGIGTKKILPPPQPLIIINGVVKNY